MRGKFSMNPQMGIRDPSFNEARALCAGSYQCPENCLL